MAEACRLGNKPDANIEFNKNENFCVFNVLCVFISLVTILADLTTDILVFAEYYKDGNLYWALTTLLFIVTPNILINVFSLRWFILDEKSTVKLWLTHVFLIGFMERYIIFLHNSMACKNLETRKLLSQRHDLNLLHFLYIFTGTIPQIILQSYAIISLDNNYYTKVFALTASNASVVWGCTSYMYSILAITNKNFKWTSLLLKLTWHFGMLIARISGIILFTVIFGIWTLLPLGLHWIAMTFWIIVQSTTFCPNKVEETMYNIIMGFVYCFCYVNLREGQTRYRLMMFYTLMVSQNFGSLFLYVLITHPAQQRKTWSIAASICIIGGTIMGMCAMILYYRYFHSKGPISWKYVQEDIELNNKSVTENNHAHKNSNLQHVRSFKSIKRSNLEDERSRSEQTLEVTSKNENENADKKFLLDHWIARTGTPTFTSAPCGDTSVGTASSIELYTVENTPLSGCQKANKITICSPTQLNLKLSTLDSIESSIDEITSININIHKRRGICSSDELREDFTNMLNQNFGKTMKTEGSVLSHGTESSNKKTSSDSIDMDLDLSFSDISSSDINTFNENIVQKLCLSALKNIKVGNQDADIVNIQKIAVDILKEMHAKKDRIKNGLSNEALSKQRDLDTPTELLSVHDYENICAVNIAREAWGLRSWNGYCDIENWLHDGSVVRDRRRDTLTSGSSDISSCISQDLRNAILAAPSFPKKAHTYSNVFVKFDKSNQEDYTVITASSDSNDETFLAKPCLVECSKDTIHLEPIIEELDDLGDLDLSNKKRLNSESSLVATIDEIRKVTATNSPRSSYHRREMWDSPQIRTSNLEYNITEALWKEPSKFDFINIKESLPEKENILGVHGSKFDLNKTEAFSATSIPLDLDNPENVTIFNRNIKRRSKSNTCNLSDQYKTTNHHSEQDLQDLSNKDIDFLWQLVSENALPLSSNEEFSSNIRTSSLQSLIHKDTATSAINNAAKISNIKKGKCKPRRKFSILRERFEHKISMNTNGDNIYKGSNNINTQKSAALAKVENEIDYTNGANSQQMNIQLRANNTKINNPDTQRAYSVMGKNIREKRSLFMKQVLSPPKFNTKLRHKV